MVPASLACPYLSRCYALGRVVARAAMVRASLALCVRARAVPYVRRRLLYGVRWFVPMSAFTCYPRGITLPVALSHMRCVLSLCAAPALAACRPLVQPRAHRRRAGPSLLPYPGLGGAGVRDERLAHVLTYTCSS